ncbi:radial spoke head 10 homolog B-like isoform X2 [Dreissena polymorpha]|uniref:radial spoke head 10 homolog B-like isoform X2 n=1 Tax=Dreissena polymorpha TaxID=45954 RepID=UPI002263D7BC|nr:radial spoke head 10 homolog B-like isoform X2 [Dreissena polymorpha]
MATKGDVKAKKGDKKSAKKLDDALANLGPSETPQAEGRESIEIPEVTENTQPKAPSPETVYDEPTLSELIVISDVTAGCIVMETLSYSGDKVRGLYHGEGEASFSGGHEYKGQFADGFMHGRGKYKWADGVTYEGEFMRNQVTGKGLYQWPDGSTYDGDVVFGKRQGVGTFKCRNSAMSYSGDWAMGKRHGKGRMDYDSAGKSYYEGDWVNNVRHGWGTRQYPSGNIYQGMWFNNVRHGEGTMKWVDRDQIYTGQWENGIQHGVGQHIWLLRRVLGSQYPLRNMFDGDFVNGLRHGYGTFYYANGAKYEGGWKNNMKHGKGKFTFKNGRIYEGMFERDHIVEYPEFTMDGTSSPDLTNIRTRTPLPMDNMSVHSNESRNTVSPSFQLDLDYLLNEFVEADRDDEASQVLFVVTRHISSLRRIYSFYSSLGHEESPDNTFVMNKMQFWRFLKDTRLHHKERTLTDMDRMLAHKKDSQEIHSPHERILQRQFINNLIVLAYHLYKQDHPGTTPKLAWCVSRLISDHILRYACNVKGHFYHEQRRACNALEYLDQTYEIFTALSTPRPQAPHDLALKMREFLFMIQDLKLINADLTAKGVIDTLAKDDPNVTDGEGSYNLELEMCFMEFFEALIGCAELYVTEAVVKDPSTPRPSTGITKDESMYSIPNSPSRLTSQGGVDEQSVAHGTPRDGQSPETASPTRAVSSAEGTIKTGEGPASKGQDPEVYSKRISNVTGAASDGGQGDTHSRHGSAKDGPGTEQHKSSSFMSTATMEEDKLVHSTVSIEGQTLGGHTEEDGEGHTQQVKDIGTKLNKKGDEEEEELDEATRQFNFWTHQIHIFFARKFLPAAEKMIRLKHAVQKRLQSQVQEVASTSATNAEVVEPNQVVVEERTLA